MHSFLLMIVAVTAASASLVRRSDPSTPVTKRGVHCDTRFFVPKCPTGFFCHQREYCYERLPLGQPCQGENLDCAEPGYCKITFGSETPGVCTHRLGVGAACYGPTHDLCAEDLACILPETKDFNAFGKCFAIPLKEGMACNYDQHCGANGFCLREDKKLVGACKPRAQLNQECVGSNADNRIAAPCGPDLGCYITDGKKTGICLKNHGGVGAKCYENGGLSCDPNQDLYCKYGPDRSNTVCARGLGLGEKCSENLNKGVVCGKNFGCYIESNEIAGDGVCLNRVNNPAGSKCNWNVFCGRDTYCSYLPGKNYGVCVKSPGKKP